MMSRDLTTSRVISPCPGSSRVISRCLAAACRRIRRIPVMRDQARHRDAKRDFARRRRLAARFRPRPRDRDTSRYNAATSHPRRAAVVIGRCIFINPNACPTLAPIRGRAPVVLAYSLVKERDPRRPLRSAANPSFYHNSPASQDNSYIVSQPPARPALRPVFS